MDVKKLVTLTFDENVGSLDRVHRWVVGAGVAGAGWYFALPLWAAITLSVLGAMWFLTGVLSKCSIYYVLGYSTCPASGRSLRGRAS
ncbi:MAG: DUF2892 domain-containing protein [Deltaproteobacteria bacterium]|nr:DUF2892 domain-containing protein [Deltaproteobacteria bacterium]